MTKQLIIEKTKKAIHQLSEDKASEIADFAEFITKRYEENVLLNDIQQAVSTGQSFAFLKDEKDLYSVSDLKEIYNG